MALTFPSSPTTGQVYTTANGITYSYNGTSWVAINSTYAIGGFRKLDSIASQFNGSNTTFNLSVSGVSITPGSAQNLNIVIGGVPQEPGVAYTLSNNSIQFTAAPTSGMSFYGVVLGDVMNIGVPSDSTVTSSKLDTNISISGTLTSLSSITANNGLYTSNNFTGTYTDGVVVDYVTGTGRISVGAGDGLTIYNGGVGNTPLIGLDSSGNLTFNAGSTITANNSMTISATSTKSLTLNGGGGSNGLVLDGSNNVGIGTAPQGYKLDVGGVVRSLIAANTYVTSGDVAGSAFPTTFVGVDYDATNNRGRLDALSGGVAWRDISINTRGGNTLLALGGGVVFIGGTSGTSRLNLTLSSGQSAVSMYDLTTSGLSWQFGPRVGTGTVTDFGFYNLSGSVFCGRFTSSGAWYQGNNSASWSQTSDKRIKKNIVSLANGLDIINSLRPVEFDYKENDRHDLGFIAQEYEMVLPDQIVKEDPNDVHKEWVNDKILNINQNLVPYLVKSIQELTTRLEALESK